MAGADWRKIAKWRKPPQSFWDADDNPFEPLPAMPRIDFDNESYDGERLPVWPVAIIGMVIAACLLMLALAAGCSTVSGGTATRKASAVRVEVTPEGGLTVEDNTNRAATTQPSANGLFKSVGLSGRSADELGSVTVLGAKSSLPQIVLGFALIGLGLCMWKIFSQLVLGLISVGAGIAAFLVPTALGIVALVGAVAVAGYFAWDSFRRVVKGVEAVKAASNGSAGQIKLMMQAAASPSTEAAVKAVK
jgi:hypothetical protein